MNRKRKPLLSFTFSLLVPGLGQLYSGSIIQAGVIFSSILSWYAAAAVLKLPYTFKGFLITIAGILGIHLVSALAAFFYTLLRKPVRRRAYNRWYVYAASFFAYYILTGLCFPGIFGLKHYNIIGSSMSPSFEQDDRIIATSVKMLSHVPARGEVLMFESVTDPSKILFCRCIALPGDTIAFTEGKFILNGLYFDEYYTKGRTDLAGFSKDLISGTVPPDTMIVLGDNRENSADSRTFGPVPLRNIRGKVLFILFEETLKRIGNKF